MPIELLEQLYPHSYSLDNNTEIENSISIRESNSNSFDSIVEDIGVDY